MKLPESPVKKTAVLMFVVADDAVSSVRKPACPVSEKLSAAKVKGPVPVVEKAAVIGSATAGIENRAQHTSIINSLHIFPPSG
jgi:hypothetical protein